MTMKRRLFSALLPLFAACGTEGPTLNLDWSIIPLMCYTSEFARHTTELKSPGRQNVYTFGSTDGSLWTPSRCSTQFPVYVSSSYTETRIPINVVSWGSVSTPNKAEAVRSSSSTVIGPDGVLYAYHVEWKW